MNMIKHISFFWASSREMRVSLASHQIIFLLIQYLFFTELPCFRRLRTTSNLSNIKRIKIIYQNRSVHNIWVAFLCFKVWQKCYEICKLCLGDHFLLAIPKQFTRDSGKANITRILLICNDASGDGKDRRWEITIFRYS